MEIPSEVIAAKEAIEGALIEAGLITGIDFGVRDEDEPNFEDLVLRIFVQDAGKIPLEVTVAIQSFPFPAIIKQRVFMLTAGFPDTTRVRPVVGGVSVAASRFVSTGVVHAGTLGAVVTDAIDPSVKYGLSNHHVLCVDLQRQAGDEIVQPEPTVLGVIPGDRVGTLHDWSFPETDASGPVDAAICVLEAESLASIADIGQVSGVVPPTAGLMVRKRGRTTGQTFGWISGFGGSYPLDFPNLPSVATSTGAATTVRTLTNQIQIHIDFPSSIVFGEHGDSGSVVIGPDNQVVGLYWASGSESLGDPLKFGLANTATAVEMALGITF